MYIIVYPIITKWAKEKWISKPKWSMTKPILFFSQFLFQNLWSNLLRLCQTTVGRLAETVSWCPCDLSLAHCPGQCGPELSMHMPWVVAQRVRILPAMRETWVQSLGWEDTLEKGMATHSIILAWRIPWTEEPGGLQSSGSQRVRHDWVTNTFTFFSFHESQRAYLWLTCHELTGLCDRQGKLRPPCDHVDDFLSPTSQEYHAGNLSYLLASPFQCPLCTSAVW